MVKRISLGTKFNLIMLVIFLAGIGLSWISPVGPLKLSYGSPIRKKPNDRIERLQFQIGTAF